uniref:CD3 epsilon subunit of T-cell receptor complex n=1 Tax=Canis lupus familiaris TaxID=9615 RepID=A0A8P0T5G4_CANLF
FAFAKILLVSPSSFSSLLSCFPGFKVSISGTEVVVTCPDVFGYDNIKWEKNDNLVEGASNRELSQKEFSEVDDSGYYACYADSIKEKSYLYLRARVCANCIEVNLMAVVTIIVADICLTLGLLLMVYYWSKTRKANAKPVMRGTGAGSRPRGQNKEKPPPVPNPDYEVRRDRVGEGICLEKGRGGTVHLACWTL